MSSLRAQIAGRVGAQHIAVELETGPRTLVIVGPNGAGKTSVLRMLLGALPSAGRIAVGEHVLLDTALNVDVAIEARGLGYVPQDYALFPHLTVRENVEFAPRSCAGGALRSAGLERARVLLAELELEAFAERPADSLSGGEQQRVALARALAAGPRALLLDEPLAALDITARRSARAFLVEYLAKLQLPAVLVTHDAADAKALGERIVVLEAGRVAQTGTWEELQAKPASIFVQELVAS